MYAFFYIRTVHPRSYCLVDTHIFSLVLPLSLHALPCCSPLALSQNYTHWPIPMGLAWIGGSCFSIYATPRWHINSLNAGRRRKLVLGTNTMYQFSISYSWIFVSRCLFQDRYNGCGNHPSPMNNPGAIYSKPNKGCVWWWWWCLFWDCIRTVFQSASNSPTRQLHEQVNIAFSTNENQRSLSSRSYMYVAFGHHHFAQKHVHM